MNSYDLSRAFINFSFENPTKIKPNHYALYFFAIEQCNRLGWKKQFGLPTTMAMEAIGIKSYNTYIKTFDELEAFSFFKVLERSKNQYSSNIIELSKFDKALDKALDKAFIKHDTKHLIKQSESTVQSTVQSIDSIIKQINKLTSKQINKLTSKQKEGFLSATKKGIEFFKIQVIEEKPKNEITTVELYPTFDDFWDLYDKKTSKPKCQKKWKELKQSDKEKIMVFIPNYKLSQPNKKYRKNPETFLNNESWNDEIIQNQNGETEKPKYFAGRQTKEDIIANSTGWGFVDKNAEQS